MARYLTSRFLYSFLALLLLACLTFFMMQAMPGDPFLKPKKLPAQIEANLRAKFGLDKPILEQLWIYLKNVASGDMGYSFENKRPAFEVLSRGMPASFELGLWAILLALITGLFFGITAALNAGKWRDGLTMLVAIIGVSVPAFVIGYLMQYYLAYRMNEWVRTFNPDGSFLPIIGWDSVKARILPVIALSFGGMASISRLMRSSMLDVISSDYIKTAKAKGLSRSAIIRKHMLRNSILPVVTILGPMTAAIMTGSFVIENIFAVPGMGRLFVIGVQAQDYTIIMATTLFYGTFLIVANLLVDLAYGLIDPRIRLAR